MDEPLPEFGNPPVSEVAVSIHFSPLKNWRAAYAGVFWSEITNDYPQAQSLAPLMYPAEKFEELTFQSPQVTFQPQDPEMLRFWFLSQDGTKLIQIQRDRFIVNWRKVVGNEIYPRYDAEIRPRFLRELTRFRKFISDHVLGEIDGVQCEITYVNDFIRGVDWNTFPEALALLANVNCQAAFHFLPAPETIGFQGFFSMSPLNGRLHFTGQHVIRQIDKKQAVQLKLFARGNPESNADADIIKWIDAGREWVVRGFTDLTSESAHKLWDRKC